MVWHDAHVHGTTRSVGDGGVGRSTPPPRGRPLWTMAPGRKLAAVAQCYLNASICARPRTVHCAPINESVLGPFDPLTRNQCNSRQCWVCLVWSGLDLLSMTRSNHRRSTSAAWYHVHTHLPLLCRARLRARFQRGGWPARLLGSGQMEELKVYFPASLLGGPPPPAVLGGGDMEIIDSGAMVAYEDELARRTC